MADPAQCRSPTAFDSAGAVCYNKKQSPWGRFPLGGSARQEAARNGAAGRRISMMTGVEAWRGKRVAFIGDSITEGVGSDKA